MELAYWILVFTNGQQFNIESEITERKDFLKHLENRGIFASDNGYITLQKDKGVELLDIKGNQLFSVQKTTVGPSAKIWRLA